MRALNSGSGRSIEGGRGGGDTGALFFSLTTQNYLTLLPWVWLPLAVLGVPHICSIPALRPSMLHAYHATEKVQLLTF